MSKNVHISTGDGGTAPVKLVQLADGTYALASTVLPAGTGTLPESSAQVLAALSLSDSDPSAFYNIVQHSNGQRPVVFSASVLTPGESTLDLGVKVQSPCEAVISLSVAGRARQAFSTVCLQNSDPEPDSVPTPREVETISQSTADRGAAYTGTAGTILTMRLRSIIQNINGVNVETNSVPPGVFATDIVNVYGLVDNRMSYQNALIKWISADRLTVVLVFTDEAAMQSLAVPVVTPPAGSVFLHFYNNLAGAHNGVGLRFTSTAPTSNVVLSVFGSGDVQVSGVPFGDHRITTATTAPVYEIGENILSNIRAASQFKLVIDSDNCRVSSRATDTNAIYNVAAYRTDAVPADKVYSARARIVKPVGISRPVARIKSISKAGNTTWNLQLDRSCASAGVVTGKWFSVKAVRDVTNFPATGALQVTVTGPDTCTVVSTAGTATSAGGVLCEVNGGIDVAPIGQVIQSVTVRADGFIELTANANWSGVNPGDYFDVIGCQNGSDPQIDGAWEAVQIASTLLTARPLFKADGVTRVSPTPAVMTNAQFGGCVFLRLTVRLHNLTVASKGSVELAQGENLLAESAPVFVAGGTVSITGTVTVTGTVNQGTAAAIGTGGAGAWPVRTAAHRTIDIASAALTTVGQTNSASIDLSGNVGPQSWLADITAKSGTNPRMFLRVQGSWDNANFFNVYDTSVMTTEVAGSKLAGLVPFLDWPFPWARLVRDLRGTSPSMTNSVTRLTAPGGRAPTLRRLLDRVLSLTSANTTSTETLYIGGCDTLQLSCTAISGLTSGTVKVQVTDGDPGVGATWFDTTALLTLSGSAKAVTPQLSISPMWTFARLATVAAANAAPADTYELTLTAWSRA